MVNKLLFIYKTRAAGYSMEEIAKLLHLTRTGLSQRLNNKIEFKAKEIETWGQLIGPVFVTPVFFPSLVSFSQPCASQEVSNGENSDC